jgi:hypothetical protein
MYLDACRQLHTVGMPDLLNNWIWSSCLLSKLPTWSTNVPVFGGNHDLVAYFKIRFSAVLIGLNSLLTLCLSQALLGLLGGFSKVGHPFNIAEPAPYQGLYPGASRWFASQMMFVVYSCNRLQMVIGLLSSVAILLMQNQSLVEA